tara:strand:+ start:1331 stop:2083 length:753 start_codon:yes stop_codon:yes gene_type:complete
MQRYAWITGGGKGIGRALTMRLVNEGWRVAISSRTEEDLVSLQAELGDDNVALFTLDITDCVANKETADKILKKFGSLDLVVLNAGTHKPVNAANFNVNDFRDLIETNLMGTVHGLAAVLPYFKQRKRGHIAIVASVAGYRGLPSAAAYGCTKAGLINMAEALKPELDSLGINLSLINPGFVKTPLTDKNDFSMPDLISAEAAAGYIYRGLEKGKFEIAFPRRFKTLLKLLRICPYGIFFWITKRLLRVP